MINDEKEDKYLVKPSGLVQIVNRDISLVQRKAYNILIYNALSNIDEEVHRIELKELKRLLSYHDFEALKREIIGLMGTVVEMNYIGDRDKQVWEAYSLLPYVKAVGEGELEYSFGLLRHRMKNPEFYAKISLLIQKKFKSRYSLALYEFCCDHFVKQKGFGVTPWIPIEDLKEILGYRGDGVDFKYFNRDVLKRAIREVNEKSDLRVTTKLKRKNRTVIAIQFLIYGDEKSSVLRKLFKPEQEELPLEGEGSELYHRLVKEFEVSPILAKDIMRRFNREHIEESLFYISKRKEKVKDLGAYTYFVITNENVKIVPPVEKEEKTDVTIPDKSLVEIEGKLYVFKDGFVELPDKSVIPISKLKQMVLEGKARIVC